MIPPKRDLTILFVLLRSQYNARRDESVAIPVLDGGHLLYYLIEVVKGSPVSDRVQLIGFKVGFFMLIGLMVFATYNDVMRSFRVAKR